MAAHDPAERALVARIAANTRWSRERDRSAATEPARAGRRARLEAQLDPNGTLEAGELARRVAQAEAAHMQRMALAAMVSRRKARQAAEAAAEANRRLERLLGETEQSSAATQPAS